MKLAEILKEEIEKISYSKAEIQEFQDKANHIINEFKKHKINAFVGGSLAKGTLIKKEKQDIDIFLVFKNEAEIKKIDSIISKIKTKGKLKKVHGSRDYYQIIDDKLILEIIPVIENRNSNNVQNVTDFSLSHVKYIIKKIKQTPKIANEIKLTKAFCQAQKIYGAESYIKGFSGYALEVLTIYFNGFVSLLKNLAKKSIIDSEHQFKNNMSIKTEINSSKLQSPLIVVDPTYKYRNITAGLGNASYEKFIKSANAFIKNPKKDFFEKKKINLDELKEKANKQKAKLLTLKLITNHQPGDIAGTKMKKAFDFFINQLKERQQDIFLQEFEYKGETSNAEAYLIIKENKKIELKGPSLKLKQAVLNFKKCHKKTYIKNKIIFSSKNISVKEILNDCKKVLKEMKVDIKIIN